MGSSTEDETDRERVRIRHRLLGGPARAAMEGEGRDIGAVPREPVHELGNPKRGARDTAIHQAHRQQGPSPALQVVSARELDARLDGRLPRWSSL